MSDRLYFVALVPQDPLFAAIEELKKDIFLHYGEEHALSAPAHLTLMPPFSFEEERIKQVYKALQEIAAAYRPFTILLRGFKFFEPRVMFVHVLQNRSLRYLEPIVWKKLTADFPAVEWKVHTRFHPHIAVASKMHQEATFFRMQKDFATKPFHGTFPVNDMAILRWEEDHWRVIKRIPLQGSTVPAA